MGSGLECRGVCLAYGDAGGNGQIILRDVSAHFHAGRTALLTGATGAGKSTLLHILAALLRPTRGTVFADGRPVSRWTGPHRDLWRRKVGMVFQNPLFFRDHTVVENTMLPMAPRGAGMDELKARAMMVLDQLEISHLAMNFPDALSGGQKQRLSLARALVTEPQFLLVDEPTAHQDDHGCEIMLRHLEQAAGRHATVVMAAHDLRVREMQLADECWLLTGGRLTRTE